MIRNSLKEKITAKRLDERSSSRDIPQAQEMLVSTVRDLTTFWFPPFVPMVRYVFTIPSLPMLVWFDHHVFFVLDALFYQ